MHLQPQAEVIKFGTALNVSFGSLADIAVCPSRVRLTTKAAMANE